MLMNVRLTMEGVLRRVVTLKALLSVPVALDTSWQATISTAMVRVFRCHDI